MTRSKQKAVKRKHRKAQMRTKAKIKEQLTKKKAGKK